MSPTHDIQEEFYRLMGDLREGNLDAERKIRLDALLEQYPALRDAYIDYVLLWHELRRYQPMSEGEHSRVARQIDIAAIEREAQRRLDRFMAEEEETRRLQPRRDPHTVPDLAGTALRLVGWLTTLYRVIVGGAVLAALLLTVLLVVRSAKTDSPVAILADSMNAQWKSDLGSDIDKDTPLMAGRFTLERGHARLVFGKGADVWIEAPADFQLRSQQRMTLCAGRLFAEVPPSAKGFRVDTPHATVIDLGTEFGLVADAGRASNLYMFKGQASLTPGGANPAEKGQLLTAGQASSVDLTGQVRSIRVDNAAFVRRFFSQSGFAWRGQPIDLADVVGGGNGFGTGRLNRWLGINTGQEGTRFIVDERIAMNYQATDHQYHRVSHLPYVDGVFSPDANAGPVQVSSQEHLWQDCPRTSGQSFEDIFNGDHIALGVDSHGFVLKGQAYGTRDHSAIVLHSNAGITFDLDAMRRDMPGLEILELRARCGLSEDVRTSPGSTLHPAADFWVLVDGKKRFEAKGMTVDSEPGEISVPLSRQERFVTLVTTEGDGRANYDWGFFAEPRLVVQSVQ
jgi:hypothetical protein